MSHQAMVIAAMAVFLGVAVFLVALADRTPPQWVSFSCGLVVADHKFPSMQACLSEARKEGAY